MLLVAEALQGRSGHEVGRRLLAELYRQATGEEMPPIATTANGKPYFTQGDWHFSISHTPNHVFCVLSEKNVGLDAEEMQRPVSAAVISRFLSVAEQARLGGDREREALRLWVLKEALAKLTGRGIGNWMKDTDFDPYDRRIQEMNGCYVAVLEEENAV